MASNQSYRNGTTMCINDSEVLLAPILRWLIPVLVVAGVLGNSMILLVLNSSKSMKTKPHLLLSAMAAADLFHTVVAFVLNLHVYESLIDSDSFSRIYHHVLKTPFLMLANWMAMTSTWLAVAVTIERLIAIRYPLKARFVMRKRIIIAAIVVIALVSFIVSSYYLFWLRPYIYVDCKNPAKKLYRLYADQNLKFYGHVSRKLHSILCSLVPVVLLFAFNGSLVYHLHRNQALMRKFFDNRSPTGHVELTEWPSNINGNVASNNNNTVANGDANGQQSQSAGATIRREYKVAVVVLVISLTSACCLLPSAALVVYDAVRLVGNITTTPKWYFPAGDISNLLVLAEKVLDFFLYCLTSGYFRRRLILVLTSRRRSSTSTPRNSVRPAEYRPWHRLIFLNRRARGSGDSAAGSAVAYVKHERRPSTSTLSTFLTSTTFRLRRSTASSDGSQRSPRLTPSARFLAVQRAAEEKEALTEKL